MLQMLKVDGTRRSKVLAWHGKRQFDGLWIKRCITCAHGNIQNYWLWSCQPKGCRLFQRLLWGEHSPAGQKNLKSQNNIQSPVVKDICDKGHLWPQPW